MVATYLSLFNNSPDDVEAVAVAATSLGAVVEERRANLLADADLLPMTAAGEESWKESTPPLASSNR